MDVLQTQQISAKAIIVKNGKALLVKDTKGVWEMPGGRVAFGEEPIEALRREIKEELGVEPESIGSLVDVRTFISKKDDAETQIVLLFFECTLAESEFTLDDESLEYAWVELEKIGAYPMRDLYREVLTRYL